MSGRGRGPGREETFSLLAGCAAGFTLAVGVWLALAGLSTSGFALAVSWRQLAPALGLLLAAYLILGLLVLAVTRRRGRTRDRLTRRLVFSMTAVTLWGFLTVSFLPLKGSETFVRAGGLSTIQLNAIGLAAVLAAGAAGAWLAAAAAARVLAVLKTRLTPKGLTALGVALIAALLIVISIGTSGSGAERTDATPRVILIGVDGCDWEKLNPLVQAGRLPNFERLMRGGSYGPLLSIEPLVSPRIWTSIATGKVAEKHGIEGFVNERNVPVNAAMWTAAPVWRIVSQQGRTVGVTGWYVTWPAEPLDGFIISDRVHSLLRGPTQAFHTMTGFSTNERLELFGGYDFDPGYRRFDSDTEDYRRNRIVDEPLRWGYLRDSIYSRISNVLLRRYRPDFSAVYFRGVDFVQHFFWKYADPDAFPEVSDQERALYGGVIDTYYEYQDRLLGRLLASVGDDVNVILVSDHGFTARTELDPSMPELTGMHDVRGVVILSGPAFRNSGRFEGATILDVAPTALAVMGLPVGEDMDGRPLLERIEPTHIADHPVTYVPTYESGGTRVAPEVGSTMDESIKEQLRSLGYIE
ncbi:MAG: alkaline phosphatase family protein [Candidatus Eisenbacteria bacterium]|nr:alkaline phosphatase family protein [Candidatus Eisenbacteria bacterium]